MPVPPCPAWVDSRSQHQHPRGTQCTEMEAQNRWAFSVGNEAAGSWGGGADPLACGRGWESSVTPVLGASGADQTLHTSNSMSEAGQTLSDSSETG